MLFKFFKPKWQNQKPEVRLRAIEEIGHDTPDSSAILEQLAQSDPDQNVRQAATSRLNNISLLVKISQHEQNEQIQRSARDRMCCLIVDQHSAPVEDRLSALLTLDSSNLLTHIVLKATDQTLQQSALERISDQDALATVIRTCALAQLRRQAAEKMTDQPLIEALIKETLGRDKRVSRIFRNKLSELQQAEQVSQALQLRCEELSASINQLANGEYFPQYGAKLQALTTEWEKVSASATPDVHAATSSALLAANERLETVKAQELATQQAQALAVAQAKERSAMIDGLRSEAASLIKNAAQNSVPESVNHEPVELLVTQWANMENVLTDQQKRFDQEHKRCTQLFSSIAEIVNQADTIQTLAQQSADTDTLPEAQLEKRAKQCRSIIKSIAWPSAENKAAALRTLENSRRAFDQQLKLLQQQSQSEFSAFEDALQQLETAIEDGQSKNADRRFKHAEQAFQKLGRSCPRNLERHFRLLTGRVQEMQEWRGYAVSPKKEALCAEMEALVGNGMEPQQLANKIRDLQQQWKLLDSTDSVHSHRIWKRFKQAADEAYKPCEAFFNSQKDVREKNLLSRQKLCDQLQTYLDGINWDEVNWKELDGLLKQVKREWREHSPVDRSPGKKVQTLFNARLAELEGPLKAYRQENGELKRRLIDDVKALLEQEDLSTATDDVKEIQVIWKETGPTFRNKEQLLWQQFRELCNDVFDRYHQLRRDQSELKSSVALEIEKLCLEMENAQSPFCGLHRLNELLEYAGQTYDEVGHQLTEQSAQRFQAVYLELKALQQALQSMQDDQVKALQRKAVLCEQLEIALLEGDYEETLTAVYDSWQDDSHLPISEKHDIDARFQTLCALAEQSGDALKSCLTDQDAYLRQLCIRLEIALGQPSPVEDQALRMEYQMQRLQQALAQQEEALNLKAVKALRCEWLCVPFSSHYPALTQRFEHLIDSLL